MRRLTTFFFTSLLLVAVTVHAQPYTGGQTDQQITQQPVQTDTTSGWQVVYTYPGIRAGFSIADLQFPSKDTGYATVWNGVNAVLLRSIDGGIHWDSLPTIPPAGLLTFTTAMTGYSVVGSDAVYKTIDGGFTWKGYGGNATASGYAAFANMDTGVIIGCTDWARTSNGGLNWHGFSSLTGICENAISFGDSKTGYVIGQIVDNIAHPTWRASGDCEKTTDGGTTWQQLYTSIPSHLWCCRALNADTLIAAGSSPIAAANICRTTDGGTSWDTLRIGDDNYLYTSISFTNNIHGMLAGGKSLTQGVILVTSDCGTSWVPQYFHGAVLRGISMLNDTVAIVCGAGNIYRTTTGGNFSSVSQSPAPDFQVQVFPNPTPGIVTIQYQLPSATTVSFTFTDVSGAVVGSIAPQLQNAGMNQVTFDGSTLANGVYYFQLSTPNGPYTGQFTIQK